MLDNFDNSILYTDYLLKNIYTYASDRLNLKAMVYFSDHGSDPYRKRHPEDSEFKASQIPLFVYTDNEYNTLFADKVKIFKEHKNHYFTNDLIYELVCDLLQI